MKVTLVLCKGTGSHCLSCMSLCTLQAIKLLVLQFWSGMCLAMFCLNSFAGSFEHCHRVHVLYLRKIDP